jgi:hypothetical protein
MIDLQGRTQDGYEDFERSVDENKNSELSRDASNERMSLRNRWRRTMFY